MLWTKQLKNYEVCHLEYLIPEKCLGHILLTQIFRVCMNRKTISRNLCLCIMQVEALFRKFHARRTQRISDLRKRPRPRPPQEQHGEDEEEHDPEQHTEEQSVLLSDLECS